MKLRLITFATSFLLLLVGCSGGGTQPQTSATSPEPTETSLDESELPRLGLKEAVKEFEGLDLSTFAKNNCSVIDGLDYEYANWADKETDRLKKMTKARDAAELVNNQEVPFSNQLIHWVSSYELARDSIVKSLEREAEGLYLPDTSWKGDFENALISNCPQGQQFEEARETLIALDSQINRIRDLAFTVPWYPDGFESYSLDVAYKFVEGRGCDYFSCWNIDVITRTSCSSLYVEMNIYDSSGSIVGFTNDSARNVGAGEVVKMRLDDLYDGSSGRITEMNCN
jgi:hypothetical protein